MASLSLALTETPKDLFSELSLDATKKYTVQNVGDRRAYFWEAVTAPDPATLRANFVEPGGWGIVEAPAAGSTWWWADEPSVISLFETP